MSLFVLHVTVAPDVKLGLLMLTAIVPKIAVSCSQSILFTCSTELVRPEKRKILLVSCVIWARIWLLTAPYIGALIEFHQLLTLSVFGMLSVIGGSAIYLIKTPRTIGKECPEKVLPTAVGTGKIFTIQ